MDAGLVFETGEDGGQDGREIGSGGDTERGLSLGGGEPPEN